MRKIVRGLGRFEVALPLLVALLVYVTALAKGAGVLNDPDPYWHIAVGRWILAHGFVPDRDIFSHSALGAPWVPHEWLAEVIMAALYDYCGWAGLAIVTAVCFSAAIALLARALLRYLAAPYALVGAVTAWAMCFPHLLARPHVFSFPLLVLWIASLVEARRQDRAPSPVLALLMVLWANLHGSFVFGLVMVALFAAEAVFDAAGRRAAFGAARGWALFGAVSLLAALLTPNGIAGLLLPLQMMRMPFTLSWVGEWKSPDFQQAEPLEFWLLLLLLGALSLGLRLPITRIGMLLLLVHLALLHHRHGELLGLAAPLLIAPALARRLPRATTDGFSLLRDTMANVANSVSLRMIAVAGALVVAVIMTAMRAGLTNESNPWAPVKALAAVEQNGVTGPVFNDYGFGGYLIFSGVAPFIDGRADMYGDAFVRRHVNTRELPAMLAQYAITWTLLTPWNPHLVLLDRMPGWRRLYADERAVVHVREAQPLAR